MSQFSIANLDYLQRTNFAPSDSLNESQMTKIHIQKLFQIVSIGRTTKEPVIFENSQTQRLPLEDALIGFYGYKIPIMFIIMKNENKLTINFGIWSENDDKASKETMDTKGKIMQSILQSVYPTIKLQESEEE